MELKVMILDDEEIILDGLCHFPWNDYGCVVIATADNGDKGLELIASCKPDIILSDIKMPGMDGLEFAEKAKNLCLGVKIILLTGYDNFDFAKQAIHIGVSDYLLKPVNFREMHVAVGNVCGEIREKRKKQKDYTELRKKYQKTIPTVRKKVISDLVYGRFNDIEEMKKRMEHLHIFVEQYVVLYATIRKNKDFKKAELEPNLFDFVVGNICEEILKQTGQQVYHEFDNLGYCFIVTFPSNMEAKDCENKCEQVCEEIQQKINSVLGVNMSMGISQLGDDAFHMNHAYEQAMDACEQGTYLGEGAGILTYADVSGIELPVWQVSDGQKKRLLSELLQGNLETAKKFIMEIFQSCPDIEVARYSAMELLLLCTQHLSKKQLTNPEKKNTVYISESIRKIYDSHVQSEILSTLKNTVVLLAEQNKDEKISWNQRSAENIKEYIQEHFTEDLSLDTLVENFKLSKTYINRLLKNYSGKSFLEILLDYRMVKAEKLIAEGEYKVYEIAEQVGYHDQSYFIRVFKKKYGVTPNSYKRI